ncbi:MAG: thioesterase family protein [Phenylobacterium sp.]|nr:thioesterase family protein [Phenylobacterium sp.]
MAGAATLQASLDAAAAGQGTISGGWDVWTPNGGYLAALVYGAMAAASRFNRPAAVYCQFLKPARHGPYDIVAEVVRSGTTSEVLRATLSQDGRAVVLATATLVADDMEGLQHRDHQAPQVPAPETLKPYEALTEDFATWPIYWRQVEGRPCRWPEEQSAGTPAWRTWLRLRGGRIAGSPVRGGPDPPVE